MSLTSHGNRPHDLEDFITRHYGSEWFDRRHEADVFRALGLSGDDCFDFMQQFADAFQVDMAGYEWSRFHLDEGEVTFNPLRRLVALACDLGNLGAPILDRRRRLVPISTSHLQAVIEAGHWFDPEGTNAPQARSS